MLFDSENSSPTPQLVGGSYDAVLRQAGYSGRFCADFLNSSNPDAVASAVRRFVQVGCDAVVTNSLHANRLRLDGYGAGDRATELAEAAVLVARRAVAGTQVKVLGVLGPTGYVVMAGDTSPNRLEAAFAEAADALAWGGADAIVLEGFGELAEAQIALGAVRRVTQLPVILTLSFSAAPDYTRSQLGNSPAQLALAARRGGATAVGAACGAGPDQLIAVCRELRENCDLPIYIRADAGIRFVGPDRQDAWPMEPAQFAAHGRELVDAGANMVGGCCGTMPEHLQALRKMF